MDPILTSRVYIPLMPFDKPHNRILTDAHKAASQNKCIVTFRGPFYEHHRRHPHLMRAYMLLEAVATNSQAYQHALAHVHQTISRRYQQYCEAEQLNHDLDTYQEEIHRVAVLHMDENV
jgi:hypothetical protein